MRKALLWAVALTLVGCSSDTDNTSSKIGPAGGTVSGPNGAQIVIPQGALAEDTTIAVTKVDSGFPPATGALAPTGDVYAFTPHGQTFAEPVTITVPHMGNGGALTLISAQPQGQWTAVPGAKDLGASMQAAVGHFSFFAVAANQADSGPVPDLPGGDSGKADAAPDGLMADSGLNDGPSADIWAADALWPDLSAPDQGAADTGAADGGTCVWGGASTCAPGWSIDNSYTELSCQGHSYKVACATSGCNCIKDGATQKTIQPGWTLCTQFDPSVAFGDCGFPYPTAAPADSGVPDAAPVDSGVPPLTDAQLCDVACDAAPPGASSCVTCTSSCGGHTYQVTCAPANGNCTCTKDGTSAGNTTVTCDGSAMGTAWNACGFPGL